MTRQAKMELLEHYAYRMPTRFTQYDGFIMDNGHDYVMRPDEDGDCIMAGDNWELMHGADVRVLIPARSNIAPQRAARFLRKIADDIERDGIYHDANMVPMDPAEHQTEAKDYAIVEVSPEERKELRVRAFKKLLPADHDLADIEKALRQSKFLTNGRLLKFAVFDFPVEDPGSEVFLSTADPDVPF